MAAMVRDLVAKYDRRVPRYTSYPTAAQFSPAIGAADYARWLAALEPAAPLSLYLHVPFCDSLCWFCGCHTKIVRRYRPVAAYLELLLAEIDLVAARLTGRRRVCHLHLGGGTPTILAPDDLARLFDRLRARFEVLPQAEIAVEVDPRGFDPELAAAMARCGVTRASLGLQDLDPEVQRAVNRLQSWDETRGAVAALRAAGIGSINVDLMYGLPHQSVARALATAETVLGLFPERVALFGYAHVPWMKRHQRLIADAALPDADARLAQYLAVGRRLEAAGYRWIGLDHFALPQDPLAQAQGAGALRRNFQGYTTDGAPARLGFGPSAIGSLPQGLVQNAVPLHAYAEAVRSGRLASARGVALDDDDRLRAAAIERLMCDLRVDLEALAAAFGADPRAFDGALAALAEMAADDLLERRGRSLRVPARGRPFLRTACAAFDRYLDPAATRHARAV